eukprot:6963189-Alexandrium_andersonii.AAC.1
MSLASHGHRHTDAHFCSNAAKAAQGSFRVLGLTPGHVRILRRPPVHLRSWCVPDVTLPLGAVERLGSPGAADCRRLQGGAKRARPAAPATGGNP